MTELTPEMRIEMLEIELETLKWEASIVQLAADETERHADGRKFKLEQIEAVLCWADTTRPITVAVVRAEFAAFVERCSDSVGQQPQGSRRPWSKSQQQVIESALDVLDDIIEGRMRVLREQR